MNKWHMDMQGYKHSHRNGVGFALLASLGKESGACLFHLKTERLPSASVIPNCSLHH